MERGFRGTTILAVRDEKSVVIVGDGQVSLGSTVMKQGGGQASSPGQWKGDQRFCRFYGGCFYVIRKI